MTNPSIEALMASMPYAAHLGIELDSATPERVTGGSSIVVQTDLTDAEGDLVAQTTQSQAVLR